MQPVRVVTPSADATLPLRMVAAGVGAQVGITLYVISEGRYEAQSPFFNAVTDDSQLRWFPNESRSNYQELSQQLMLGHYGHTWLTEYSQPTPLLTSPYGGPTYCGTATFPGLLLADVYLGQCKCKDAIRCVGSRPAEAGVDALADDDGSAEASDDAGDEASSDASGDAPNAGDGVQTDGGCNPDPCAGFDDLDVALVGIHPQDSWVTRLRAVLPVQALSEGDLHIQAAASQTSVSSQHATNGYVDPKYHPCANQGGCSATAAQANLFERWLIAGTFALTGVALIRRRRR